MRAFFSILLATSRRKIPNRGERSVAAVRQRWEGVLELLDQCGRIVEWKKGGKVRPGVEEERSGFLLVGQVGADVYHIVGDHSESNETLYAVESFVSGSLQPVPAFQNTDAALASGAPFL